MAKPTLYFDVDGVIARFTDAACALHGRPNVQPDRWDMHTPWGLSDTDFYAGQDRTFWSNLGVWEDGMALFRYAESLVGQENMVLLTSPVQTDGCSEGKRDWVKKHLPHWLPDLVIGGAKHKLGGPGKLLIDDSDSNCGKFHRSGAVLLVPRPWNKDRDLCDAAGMFHVPSMCSRLELLIRRIEAHAQ